MGMRGGYNPEALERLRFRRQFYLGPDFLDGFPGWKRIAVGGSLRLSVHPDLEAYQATSEGRSVTLLGYVLDPGEPHAGNADIVNGLLPRIGKARDSWKLTREFGGRWILIVDDGEESVLFSDAAGMRQVCHARHPSSKAVVCASQPGLIAGILGLAMDEEAVGFIHSREYDDYEVYWLPGDTTLYQEIRVLLPNHCLDLRSGEARRYWPDADLKGLSRREALVESSRLLHGLMRGAARRFELALSMTAGWDSRVMLALSREIAGDVYSFTLAYPHAEGARDVRVPAALLKKLGLRHSIMRYPEHISAEFKKICKQNNVSANDAYCPDAQAMYEQYPEGRVCITGDVAEVVKCHYRLPERGHEKVSAQDLADLCRIGNHPFLIRAFEGWLATADARNVPLLDLFCWEQMGGRWQALIRAQHDIVHESFVPFNCRSLLETMLSVDEGYRRGPQHQLLREIMQDSWSEVLSVPINPPEKVRAKALLARLLKSLGIYQLVPEPAKALVKRLWK